MPETLFYGVVYGVVYGGCRYATALKRTSALPSPAGI